MLMTLTSALCATDELAGLFERHAVAAAMDYLRVRLLKPHLAV